MNYDLSPHQWTFDFSSGKIKLRANPKFVVNVVDSDLGDDSTINLWEDNDSDTQKWDFKDGKLHSKADPKRANRVIYQSGQRRRRGERRRHDVDIGRDRSPATQVRLKSGQG